MLGAMTDRAEDLAHPLAYPREWEADVVLADGLVAHVRPIVPGDTEGIHAFHAGQSPESIYLRFFATLPRLSDKDVRRFTHVDHLQRVALVMTIRDEIAGIGRYDRIDGPKGPTAEVAFNVADQHHGRGIGSVLLEHLAAIGREAGVRRFVADVLPQNRRMIGVFTDMGFEVSHELDDGVIAVSFDIEPTDASDSVRMAREHRAEAVSMRRVLTPSSVAVIGVSRAEDSVGRALFRHIRQGGYTGRLYAVNPAVDRLDGHQVLPSLAEADGPVDLAVIAVPAEQVLAVVRQCADAGVAAVIVVSAGFAEDGPEGETRQGELLRTARAEGIRVLGPNSFGLINNDPQVSLNASLSPRVPPAGSFGLFAQSGALGIAVLASAERRGLGISTFASAGNRVDISGNDLMQYWIDDDSTAAVGLYLESMGNPRKFTRIARRLACVKPVVVVKSGVSRYGVPPGHRVRVTREAPEAFDAMLRQSGVIRVENAHQLFDVAQLVVHQPLPAGQRVAVVTNSAALGALAADACLSWNLEVSHGPVALPATGGTAEFALALGNALQDPQVDSLVACLIPPVVTDDTAVIETVAQAARRHDKPCVATFLGMRGVTRGGDLPAYPLPEDAVRALAAATRYAQWRSRVHGERVRPGGVERRRAHDLVETVLAQRPTGRDLDHEETTELLAAYGIELWPSPGVPSREVTPAMRAEQSERAEQAERSQAPSGTAVQITSAEDPLFGPVVGFGVAGLPVDLLGDVAHRFPPLTDVDVVEMVASVRAAPVLAGYRGAVPVDLAALHDLIARVSVLADDLPEIGALRLDPVVAHDTGVAVLGASVHLAPDPGRTDSARRALDG